MKYQKELTISGMPTGHVQGIAVDRKREYMYYSFTTCLLKTDMTGRLVGSVQGLAGHLGCIAYHAESGKVYGSLEYKHDSIGTGILKRINSSASEAVDVSDGFYVVIFDADKIDRMDMDAERDGIMTSVCLNAVLEDYDAPGHRYGCSGIDGITFAPMPGECGAAKYLYVAYGIYGDTDREDNDHQLIHRYDIGNWSEYEKPLNQSAMHRSGPDKPDSRYFIYTGNTAFGVQNLEYDAYSGCMFAAVYRGCKEHFPNYPMYVIDFAKASECRALCGLLEQGEVLSLAEFGQKDEKTGIWGIEFPYGATGMLSLGDGYFYFSRDFREGDTWGTNVGLYRLEIPNGFAEA